MKRYFVFVAIIFGVIAPSISAQTAKQKVAVYMTGDVDNGYKKVIGSKLVTGITRSEQYVAVERTADFLSELTKEQDYQMSGAVSDNQIARLGQQFGVRFVLVADVSEVFESMFISARMIDVQTAQITNSTESSANVNNIDGLTELAEDIVWEIMKTQEDPDAIIVHNISDFDDFAKVSDLCPKGYHMAMYDEVIKMIDNNRRSNKKMFFPIYLNLQYTNTSVKRDYTLVGYFCAEKTNNYTPCMICSETNKVICDVMLDADGKLERLNLEYIDDPDYSKTFVEHNKYDSDGSKLVIFSTEGLSYIGTTKPKIEPGFIYFIKDKNNNNNQ